MPPQAPSDAARASEIVKQLRTGIEKYKDYHVALNDGYKIFLPNLPQPEYHFTNYLNGFLEALSFDPARPTSLLYKKTSDGYQLVGAMYTMPKRATEEQLNTRAWARSEEHTSELQSQSNLVCRLLLEKKKKNNIQIESQRNNTT